MDGPTRNAGAQPLEKPPMLVLALDRQREEIERLQHVVAALPDRLKRVSQPQNKTEKASIDKNPGTGVILVDEVDSNSDRIRNISNMIREVMDSVEC